MELHALTLATHSYVLLVWIMAQHVSSGMVVKLLTIVMSPDPTLS